MTMTMAEGDSIWAECGFTAFLPGRSELARLKLMIFAKERSVRKKHKHTNFLTFMHSKYGFLPRMRKSWRRALVHWFCAGVDDYSSLLKYHVLEPIISDRRAQVGQVLNKLSETLEAAEQCWDSATENFRQTGMQSTM